VVGEASGNPWRLVLYLGLGNLLVFGLFSGLAYWGGRDRGLPEFNADKIRLLEQPASPTRATPRVPSEGGGELLCYRIATLEKGRYQAFRDLLEKFALDGQRYALVTDSKLPWWVYWPPEYEATQREAAQKKFTLVGVKDVLPITKGPMAQSYSLGMFPVESQARAQRDVLRQKGLEKTEYGIRPGIGAFQLRLVVDHSERAESLKAMLPTWAEPVEPAACGG
jgi:hypothetical protein